MQGEGLLLPLLRPLLLLLLLLLFEWLLQPLLLQLLRLTLSPLPRFPCCTCSRAALRTSSRRSPTGRYIYIWSPPCRCVYSLSNPGC